MAECTWCKAEMKDMFTCRGKFVCEECHSMALEGPCDRCGKTDPAGLSIPSWRLAQLLCGACFQVESTVRRREVYDEAY